MIWFVSGDGGTDGNAGIDTGIPNVARVYDYVLGGTDNYPADRALGDQLRTALPDSVLIAQNNRAFLGRAVRYCAEQGITQFLDVGSGLPTVGNVHEVVRMVAPGATMVYVDIDRTAIAHANACSRPPRARRRSRATRERALNAEGALKAAHNEILAQRTRIGELLGQVRDLQSEWTQEAIQRITTENTTLKQRVRTLTAGNRTLEEKLKAARENLRFHDKRIADLEAQLAPPE